MELFRSVGDETSTGKRVGLKPAQSQGLSAQGLQWLRAQALGSDLQIFILAPQFPHLVALRSYFASMGLSFFICKMEVILVSVSL